MEFKSSQESCLTGLIESVNISLESGNRASKKESRRPNQAYKRDF